MSERQSFIIGGPDVPRHQRAHRALQEAYRGLDLTKRHQITIEPYVREATSSQRGLYFMWCDLIALETGNDKDDIHEAATRKFCPLKKISVAGNEIEVRSIKHLKADEMYVYMERVQAWAATMFNVTLPPPEDQNRGAA